LYRGKSSPRRHLFDANGLLTFAVQYARHLKKTPNGKAHGDQI